jgi:hypothetical protein
MDKDLKQIGGFIYDFYCKPSKKDEEGQVIEFYPRRGLSYVTRFEGQRFLAKQMIMGDAGDRVAGLPRYGEVKSSRIVEPLTNLFGLKRAVVAEYMKVYGEDYADALMLNFRLLYLGRNFSEPTASVLLAAHDTNLSATIVEGI